MHPSRLIRHTDALMMLETLAFLIRTHGLPQRPPVPSPLREPDGLDRLVYQNEDDDTIMDWAQDAFSRVLHVMQLHPSSARLISSRVPCPQQPGLVTFDPNQVRQPGQFVSRLILELVESRVRDFDPGFTLTQYQKAIIRLTTCAYFRQGFVLTQCLPATTANLSHFNVPQRFVENILTTATCLSLTLCRQAPEQIIATYSPVLTKSVRRKIRPACRQLRTFKSDIKILQMTGQRPTQILTPSSTRPRTSQSETDSASSASLQDVQPQRISWT